MTTVFIHTACNIKGGIKTNTNGAAIDFAWPDPTYFASLIKALAAKGVFS